jgi:TPP-dependent pyruvate/acetoin dehydrogenase alpha subunit
MVMATGEHTFGISLERALDLLWRMLLIRRIEDKCADLYTQEKIHGFQLRLAAASLRSLNRWRGSSVGDL